VVAALNDQGHLTNKRQPKFKIITTFIFIVSDGEVIFKYGSLSSLAVGSFLFLDAGFCHLQFGIECKK
jgi:hypothetical protein